MANIVERAHAIRTREDLIAFLKEFSQDYRENPKSWDNDNLGSFLEALAAWADSMEGYYLNRGESVPETPQWKTFADLLMAAKTYE